jgi:hypothetical protein
MVRTQVHFFPAALKFATIRSPVFDLSEVGETHLKVPDENGGEVLLRADVALSGAIVFITINLEERGYPIRIENASDYSFTVTQAVSLFAARSSLYR